MPQFYGKYRGTVENNIDPLMLGRIQVSVPVVLGDGKLSWAMPCVPYAGDGVGFFAIPPIGANVWVEFEEGCLDSPIWSGCFWGTGQVPASPALAEMKVFKTDSIELAMSDLPGAGGVMLKVDSPAVPQPLELNFDSKGIEITNSVATIAIKQSGVEIELGAQSIKISPASVSINSGALEVM